MTQKKERILIIKLSAFGDFILALGPIEAIRKHHSSAHITLLTTRAFADLAHLCPHIDTVMVDERPKFWQLGKWLRLKNKLNSAEFTRVYDLQNNDRSATYFRLLSPKPEWVGVHKGVSHQYKNPNWKWIHALDRHKDMLELAGIKKMPFPDLQWMKTDVSFFNMKKPYVLLIPGSAPTHPGKRWPAFRYAGLAQSLIGQGYEVALIGTHHEKNIIETILKSCPQARDLSNKTSMLEIASLAKEAAATIGNDTGPSHLAAINGCPSVVLFSNASDPERSAPRGDRVVVIQSDNLNDLSVKDVMAGFTKVTNL